MLCARCGLDNPDGSRFCAECGAVLLPEVAAEPEMRAEGMPSAELRSEPVGPDTATIEEARTQAAEPSSVSAEPARPASPPKAVIPCPRCGRAMPAGRDLCETCTAEASGLPPIARTRPEERPGCVTAYAILLWIASVLVVWGGIELLNDEGFLADVGLKSLIPGVTVRTLAGLLIGEAVLNVAIGFGLWRMKNWARILIVIIQSLALVLGLISTCSQAGAMLEYGAIGTLLVRVLGLAVNGLIAAWFASHGEYFT